MVKKLIYQTFQELLDKTPSFSTKFHQAKKGGGATPDEIVNWFKKNKPEKLESIMETSIIKARAMSEGQRRSAVSRKRSVAQGVGGKPTNVKTFAKRKQAMMGGFMGRRMGVR